MGYKTVCVLSLSAISVRCLIWFGSVDSTHHDWDQAVGYVISLKEEHVEFENNDKGGTEHLKQGNMNS